MHSLTVLLRPFSMVALCAATPALAQTSGGISLTQVSPTALRLRVENPTVAAGSVQVERLSSGQILFTESYPGPVYGHRFDFSQVPSGRYLLRLQAGGQVHRCLVLVHTRNQESSLRVTKMTARSMPASIMVKNLAVTTR